MFFLEVFKTGMGLAPLPHQTGTEPLGETSKVHFFQWVGWGTGWVSGLAQQDWVPDPHVEKQGIGVVWVGEIYNIRSIGKQLLLEPDAPLGHVLAKVFRTWGSRGFNRLEGDYSLVLWLSNERLAVAVRDGMGTHLLYYRESHESRIFSNEAYLVGKASGSGSKLSPSSLLMWACNGYDETIPLYKGGICVQRGTALEMHESGASETQFWSLSMAPILRYRKLEDYVAHLEELIGRCVLERCQPGGTALMLSGGLDSAAVATFASFEDASLLAMTYQSQAQPSCNEWRPAQALVKFLGIESAGLDADAQWLLKDHEQVSFWPDPFFSWDSLTRTSLECMATKGKRVLLTGHGGDSMFSGLSYPLMKGLSLRWHAIKDWRLARMAWRESGYSDVRGAFRYIFRPRFGRAIGRYRKWPNRLPWIPRAACSRHFPNGFPWSRLATLEKDPVGEAISQMVDGHSSGVRRAIHWLHRIARARNIAIRHPLFDKRLAEFVVGIPPEILRANQQKKGLLAEVLRLKLPSALVHSRTKPSLVGLYGDGLHKHRDLVMNTMDHSILAKMGMVNQKKLQSELQRYYRADPAVALAWFLPTFSTELWIQKALDQGFLLQ